MLPEPVLKATLNSESYIYPLQEKGKRKKNRKKIKKKQDGGRVRREKKGKMFKNEN